MHHGFVGVGFRFAREPVIKVARSDRSSNVSPTKRSSPVRQISSTGQTTNQTRGRGAAVSDDQQALMRGVVHGVILSVFVWTAALYLTLVL